MVSAVSMVLQRDCPSLGSGEANPEMVTSVHEGNEGVPLGSTLVRGRDRKHWAGGEVQL